MQQLPLYLSIQPVASTIIHVPSHKEKEGEKEGRNQQDGRREGDRIYMTDVQYTLRRAVILCKEFSFSAKHE